MKRMYVTIEDLSPLIDWLKTEPDGTCQVLIGGTNDVSGIMAATTAEGRDFARWVLAKMEVGELDIKATMEHVEGLPIGVVLE